MRFYFQVLSVSILILIFSAQVNAQNRYTPPDPYSITENKLFFSKYMIMNTAFLGPNGLPVPRLHEGNNPQQLNLEMKYEYYFQEREKTHDALVELKIPISDGKVALEFRYVPFEFYTVSESLSRERRTESGSDLEGKSLGDVYFGTTVQLIKDHSWLPDILFGMSCKTASGTGLQDARHTDSPGYYLDLSFGKSYFFGNNKQSFFRWYMLGGFYAWQTYIDEFPQNDAILYGLGFNFDFKKIYFSNSLRGLSGWMFNGDQPMVFYSELGIREGKTAFIIGYEYGITDYPFTCLRLGFKLDGIVQ